jgi:hypothetical protein
MPNVYARTLKAAALLLGGEEELSRRLGASPADMAAWTQGSGVPPVGTLLKAAELLTNGGAASPQSASWKFRLRAALSRVAGMGTGIAARRVAIPRR